MLYSITAIPYINSIVNDIVSEKEIGIRESMQIMGQNTKLLFPSLLIVYSITSLIQSIVTSIIYNLFLHHEQHAVQFIINFLFYISLFFFIYMLTGFFSRTRRALFISTFIMFLTGIMSSIVTTFSPQQKIILAFIPSINMGFICKTLQLLDQKDGMSINFSDLSLEQYSFGIYCIVSIASMIIYYIIGEYLNNVIPSIHGTVLPWYYPIRYFIKKKKYSNDDDTTTTNTIDNASYTVLENPLIDTNNNDYINNIVVYIRNLYKIYYFSNNNTIISIIKKLFKKNNNDNNDNNKLIAVNNLSIDQYNNQILALLGHNGAGKTTFIKSLIGFTPITSGTIKINNALLKNTNTSNLENVDNVNMQKPYLGYCPQHNILYDNLTVHEHLTIYGLLKGVNRNEIENEILNISNDIGLGPSGDNKLNTLTKDLSGGQKRKLCIGIALIGDSRIVVLDEPTSGVDIESRLHILSILENIKNNRTILLTTHSMEEAERSDRIAIMSNGILQCIGTPIFLKNKFGIGYKLKIIRNYDNTTVNQLKYDNDELCNILINKYKCLEYITSTSKQLTFIIKTQNIDELKYIFNHIDANEDEYNIKSYSIEQSTLTDVFIRVSEGLDKYEDRCVDNINNDSISDNNTNDNEKIYKETTKIIDKEYIFDGLPIEYNEKFLFDIKTQQHKYIQTFINSFDMQFQRILYPLAIFIVLYTLLFFQNGAPRDIPLTQKLYPEPTNMQYYEPGNNTEWSNMIQRQNQKEHHITPIPFKDSDIKNVLGNYTTIDEKAITNFIRIGNKKKIINNTYFVLYLKSFSNVSNKKEYNIVMYSNYTYIGNTMISYSALMTTLLQYNTKVDDIYNMEVSSFTTEAESRFETVLYFPLSILISFIYVFTSCTFFIVNERYNHVRHLLRISNINSLKYYTACFIWDFTLCIILAIQIIIYQFIQGAQSMLIDNITFLVPGFILFLIASLSYSYAISYLFSSPITSQTITYTISLFIGTILLDIYIIIDTFVDNKIVAPLCLYIFRISPYFCFLHLFYGILATQGIDMSLKYSGRDILMLCIDIILFILIIYIIEKNLLKKLFMSYHSYNNIEDEEDIDVKNIRESIERDDDINDNKILVVKGLSKTYTKGLIKRNKFDAVKNIFFNVDNNECFGFLGANGAGKTSTIKILTLDEYPSKGTAKINNYDIINERRYVYKQIGYCPQQDHQLEELTPKDIFNLFASLRGLNSYYRDILVSRQINFMNFDMYKNIKCKNLSGGNKRKVCLGISVLSNPKMLFLDEPTSNMDPKSRGYIWNLIENLKKSTSIMLTSHLQDECELLCDTICIIVKGKIRCIGSLQHLQYKYSKFYYITLYLNTNLSNTYANNNNEIIDNIENIQKDIIEYIKNMNIIKNINGNITDNIKFCISIPREYKQGTIFNILHECKQIYPIDSFVVTDIKLEDIFINVVNESRN